MDVFKSQGYSDITPIKQEQFSQIIKTHIACSFYIMKKYPNWCENTFYYFDINAGTGKDEDGNKGSPLIFLDAVSKYDMRCVAILIEKNKHRYLELSKNTVTYLDKSQVICRYGDHHEILPEYFISNNRHRFGLLYADPNGKPSFDIIAGIAKIPCYSKLDVLVNCSATTVKRSGPNNPVTKGNTLKKYLSSIDKKFWMVREPYGKQQWSFILGTNWAQFPKFEKIGMHLITSEKGIDILNRLNSTAKEGENESE